MPAKAGTRRVGMPRAKSTSNMLDDGARETLREYARGAVAERDNMRALAAFFRTTSPPSDPGEGPSQDWLCGAPEGRKPLWSGQSLRRAKRSKSQQFALPGNVTLETTAEGRRYAAISPPVSIKNSGPWFQAPETIFRAPTMLDKAAAPCPGPGPGNTSTSSPPGHAGHAGHAGPATGHGNRLPAAAGPAASVPAPAPELPPAMWPLRKSSMSALSPSIPSRRSSVGAARSSPNTPPRTGPARRAICIASSAADDLPTPAKTRPARAVTAAAHSTDPRPALTEQSRRPLVTSRRLRAAQSSLGPESPETPPVTRGGLQDEEPSWPAAASDGVPTASLSPAPADLASRSVSSSSSASSTASSIQQRRQMPRMPSGGPVTGTPLSPRKSAKRPPMLSVQPQAQAQTSNQTSQSPVQSMPPHQQQKQLQNGPLHQASSAALAVPDSNLPPESPGFPNMLAAMTFPAPPSSSRPSTSRSNSSGTITSSPAPQAPSPHTIRPRTSSWQASGQHPSVLPPASLNEIVMRPDRPRLQHAQSEGAISDPSAAHPSSLAAASHEPDVPAQSIVDEAHPPVRRKSQSSASILIMGGNARPESCDSFATARERPDSVYSAYELGLALRHSSGSDCTVATSHRQSTTTDDTQRRSTRSDVTAATSIHSTNSDGNDPKATMVAHCDPLGLITPMEAAELASAQLARVSLGTPDANLQGLLSGQGWLSAEDVMAISAAGELGVPPAQSLLERRMARKVSAAEYSHGEGFATPCFVTDSVDSPVLGWFPNNAARSRLIRSQPGPSPLTPESCPSASLPPDAGDKTPSARELSRGQLAPAGTEFFPQLTPKASRVSMATSQALSWSTTMTMETVPEDPPRSPSSDKGPMELSVSPLYIVAHIEPETPAITPKRPRPLSMMFLEHQFAEQQQQQRARRASQVKPRKQRPLSVKIARNSLTGALERTVSNPPNMNRIPTPPQSPEPRASKRLSIIPRLPIALPTPEPTPLSRRVDGASESDSESEPRQDPAQRIAAIRERLRREKQLKDEEIANMVARTVVSSPSKSEMDDDSEGYNASEEDTQNEHSLPPDIQCHRSESAQQLEGIEVPQDDAWTGVMGPLMKKMSKMLLEMQGDGMCSGLRMSEFSFDLEAPEKRVSFYNQTSILVENTKLAVAAAAAATSAATTTHEPDPMFDGFDGTHHAASTPTIGEEMAESDQEISPRTLPPGLAKQRLELESQADKAAEVEEAQVPDVTSRATPSLKSPGSLTSLPATPRTPQEQHEQDAQMAILRRIQQQELMMDQLMNKWGTPSTGRWSKPRMDDFGSFSEISQPRGSMSSTRPSEDDTQPNAATGRRERSGTGMEMVDPLMRELRRDSHFSIERDAKDD